MAKRGSIHFWGGSLRIVLNIGQISIMLLAGRRWALGWYRVRPLDQWSPGFGNLATPGKAYASLFDA